MEGAVRGLETAGGIGFPQPRRLCYSHRSFLASKWIAQDLDYVNDPECDPAD